MRNPVFALLVTLGLLAALACPAAAASSLPEQGTYAVQGWEPGSDRNGATDYTGQVELTKKGDGYWFKGSLDNVECSGVCLFDPRSGLLSLMFESADGSSPGVGVLRLEADGSLHGAWLYLRGPAADGRTGLEIWTKKK